MQYLIFFLCFHNFALLHVVQGSSLNSTSKGIKKVWGVVSFFWAANRICLPVQMIFNPLLGSMFLDSFSSQQCLFFWSKPQFIAAALSISTGSLKSLAGIFGISWFLVNDLGCEIHLFIISMTEFCTSRLKSHISKSVCNCTSC